MKFVSPRLDLETVVVKRENAGNKQFLFFLKCLQKAFLFGSLDMKTFVKGLNGQFRLCKDRSVINQEVMTVTLNFCVLNCFW